MRVGIATDHGGFGLRTCRPDHVAETAKNYWKENDRYLSSGEHISPVFGVQVGIIEQLEARVGIGQGSSIHCQENSRFH
jgi:hypothetical protein